MIIALGTPPKKSSTPPPSIKLIKETSKGVKKLIEHDVL